MMTGDGDIDRILGDIGSSIDRLNEAHYWLHQMEINYHFSNQFRWSMNAFLIALKSVRGILNRELQGVPGFREWKAPHYEDLDQDKLLRDLGRARDVAVHQSQLRLRSSGAIGLYQGGLRLGLGVPINPDQDSDTAIQRFLSGGDPFGLLMPDEDTMPCVRRLWRLPEYDEEIVQLCAMAWLRISGLISAVIEWRSGETLSFDLACRMRDEDMMFRLYDRAALVTQLKQAPQCPFRV